MNEEYMNKFHPELAEYYQKDDCCTWIVKLRKQVSEKDKEIERLNNIINELEKMLLKLNDRLNYEEDFCLDFYDIDDILDKLKELKKR